jgi:hypothetical protein
VPVIINDGTDDSAAFDLEVVVQNTVNLPPEFTSTPDLAAIVDEVYTYDVVASDPDANDTLQFAAALLPAWLTLTNNGDRTATLSGTPLVGDVGANAVSLEVTDGLETVMQDFTINVEVVPSNNPPTIDSTPVTGATAGAVYTYNVETTDLDGDPLIIEAPTAPDWLTLTDNGDGSATLTGTPDAGDVGEHDVLIEVSDGTDTVTQSFEVTVVAAPNNPPVFTSTAVLDATVGDLYTYGITTNDADGDTVTIEATTLPAWLTFTDNGDGTATLTGTPVAANEGDHAVVLEVSDAEDSNTQTFTVTVEDDTPPPPPPPPPSGGGGGGGSLGFLSLLALMGFARARLLRHSRLLRDSR